MAFEAVVNVVPMTGAVLGVQKWTVGRMVARGEIASTRFKLVRVALATSMSEPDAKPCAELLERTGVSDA